MRCALRLDDTAACWALRRHTCGRATYEKIICWNDLNQGTLPTNLSGDAWRTVTAGLNHTCGIDVNDLIARWSDNTYGQLG